MSAALVRVPFRGDDLLVKPGDTPGSTMIVMRPIVEKLGLDWSGQRAKMAAHPVLRTCVGIISMQIGDQQRDVTVLSLAMLPFWFATIQTARIQNPDIRAVIFGYQREAADVLFAHFFPGRTSAPGLTASTVGGVAKAVMHKALGEHLVPIAVDLAEQRAALAGLTAKIDRMAQVLGAHAPVREPVPAGTFNSALVFLIEIGWPQRGRRAMVNAVSARLAWFCAERGYPTRLTAERGIRLFSIDAIAAWRRAGGDAYLAACRDRMSGPGRAAMEA